MNPATPGPLTVLLVPPDGDTTLLAPEWCGGRAPEMHRDVLAPPGWSPRPAPDWHIEGVSPTYDRALVLVHEGAPVAMGCDRLVHVLANERWPRCALPCMGYGASWDARDACLSNPSKIRPREWWLGCDWVDEGDDYEIEAPESIPTILLPAWTAAKHYADTHPGARVVLLRDGQEVGS